MAPPSPLVVLVHGLWFNRSVMALLAWRLRRCGFRTETFGYASVCGSLPENAGRLARRLADFGREPVHLVGHSLGGLVILRMLRDQRPRHCGRVVMLGSPVRGSRTAERAARLPVARRLIGSKQGADLREPQPPWHGPQAVGMIAGDRSVGIGAWLGAVKGPNDGAVTVEETRLEGLADHIVVHAAHLELVLSPAVARQVCRFLREGQFERTGPP